MNMILSQISLYGLKALAPQVSSVRDHFSCPMLKYFCLIAASLYCLGLGAKPNPDSLKTYTLPTIRVIVDKPSQAIGSLVQLHTDDSASAANLREAFAKSVGISASTGTKDESNLRLRGFRKNEVKVMIDGRPLNNGYFGNVDLSKLSLMGIQEIQIIKGPASPLFGTNSMGGVVNIISSEASKKNWLSLNALLKRNNSQEYQLRTAHGFDSWNYSLAAALERSSGFVLATDFQPTFSENGGVRNSSAKNQYNLRGSLSSDFFTFHRLSFDCGYSGISRKDIPSSIYERKYRYYENWRRYNASLTGEFRLGESLTLSTLVMHDGGGDRYLEYNDPNHQYVNVDSRMTNQSWGFAPRFSWQPGSKSNLDFGYHGELQMNSRKDNMDYPDWSSKYVQTHSIFCQYELQATRKMLITAALGLAGTANQEQQRLKFHPEPALGLVYTGESGTETSLAMGINSAQPTLHQLYSFSKGNPALQPQTAVKLELSHNQPLVFKTLSLLSSVYANDTRDLIDLEMGRFQNISHVLSYGAEFGFVLSPTRIYELEANYAWLDFQRESDYRLTETPRHSVELSHRLKLPAKSSVQINSSFRGERLSQDDLGNYHALAAYWRHDLQFNLPLRKHKFFLGLENILDEDYQGEYGFPEAGRNFVIGCNIVL